MSGMAMRKRKLHIERKKRVMNEKMKVKVEEEMSRFLSREVQ